MSFFVALNEDNKEKQKVASVLIKGVLVTF